MGTNSDFIREEFYPSKALSVQPYCLACTSCNYGGPDSVEPVCHDDDVTRTLGGHQEYGLNITIARMSENSPCGIEGKLFEQHPKRDSNGRVVLDKE
ncbi:hypothetical protein HYT25_01445 [Candidatus Pacearchaeota archaeon]|nr:hypothetical protein [Candidatus Pacearchaeota archaeon]